MDKQNGAVDVTVSGGALPYTYNWDNGATTEDISGLAEGTYDLTVTDANGCEASVSATVVNDAGSLSLDFGNAMNEVCGNGLGNIDIVISGGNQPYSYSWSNGATTEDLLNLSAGDYSCVITDNSGCSISTPVYTVLNESGTLSIDAIDVDNEVCGNGLGEIEIIVSGGVVPYTFLMEQW